MESIVETNQMEQDDCMEEGDWTKVYAPKTEVKDESTNEETTNDEMKNDGTTKEGTTNGETANVDMTSDEYQYLNKGEYSSEMFKVCVKNIPKNISFGCFRQGMVSALGFKPKKIKYFNKNSFAFLGLQNEEERLKAIEILDGRQWKKVQLECVKAAPAKDPFVVQNRKRKQKSQDEGDKKQKYDVDNDGDNIPPEDKIVNVVCPYASMPYEEQLSMKSEHMRTCMKKLTYKLGEALGKDKPIEKKEDGLCLELLPIIRSPVLYNYRNKVEFSIGSGPDEKDNTVGFRLSSYKEGNLTIVEPTKCVNVDPRAVQVAKEFQIFIQSLNYPSYSSVTHEGFWQQLTVRTCTTDDVMAIIQVHPTAISSEDEYTSLQEKLREYFNSNERTVKVSSVFLSSPSQKNISTIDTFVHLTGERHIKEKLLGLQFRISPSAFFQVNTKATEILYETIRDWCNVGGTVSPDGDAESGDGVAESGDGVAYVGDGDAENGVNGTCILDVCCGTGTIGLCVANGTNHQVTGIEISDQAIEDAKHNAEINGVTNANFICSPAEDVIGRTMKTITSTNIIAIIDPPRAGLRRGVVETLRECSAIKRIIYVSCSPNQACDNFVWFCRPESKRFKGPPFKTARAVPVDLFPHTKHCELIMELVRD